MFPVFSLVLDQDVKPETAMLYPELYKDLTKVPARDRASRDQHARSWCSSRAPAVRTCASHDAFPGRL